MSEQLIIRLPGDPETPVSWLVWNKDQRELVASGEMTAGADLAGLGEKAAGRQVLVFVSTLAVGLHEINLPAKSRRHLRQVIPYALEDELAEDIEDVHFAWPEPLPRSEGVPVAVVARAQMDTWLALLGEAGVPVSHLYPDLYLLPTFEDEWSMTRFGPEWILRTGAWQGTALDVELLDYFVPDSTMSEPTTIRAYGALEWHGAPAPVVPHDPALPLQLAVDFQPQGCINLMQGDYRVQSASDVDLSKLKFPAMAAAIFVAVLLLNKWTTAIQLERDTRQLAQQTESLYLQTFPNETRVQDPVGQMERHVRALGGGQQGHVLEILQRLEPAFSEAQLQLTMLQFDASRGELRLQANGANFQTFERFTQAARAQELEVSQGQLTSRGGQINGTILVRRGS